MLIRSVNLFGGDFMSKVVNGRIILDKEESKEFLKDIFHPDVEALKKGTHSSKALKIGSFNA